MLRKIKIDKKYLGELNCGEAFQLLDTIIHEVIHTNSSWWELLKVKIGDPHQEVYQQAFELTNRLIEEFNNRRGVSCP